MNPKEYFKPGNLLKTSIFYDLDIPPDTFIFRVLNIIKITDEEVEFGALIYQHNDEKICEIHLHNEFYFHDTKTCFTTLDEVWLYDA